MGIGVTCSSEKSRLEQTGATGARQVLCSSQRDPLKGALTDEWSSPSGPNATGAGVGFDPLASPGQLMLGLSLPADTTFEQWSDLGRKLCRGARTINWLIGDWLIAGSERFGDKARAEANAIFRSDVERFDPIVKTCRRFPEAARHPALTFGHHLAVMAVPDDGQAETLLSRAESDQMTTAALKAEVKLVTAQRPLIADDDPEDTAYRAMVQAWNRAPKSSREAFIESAAESHLGVIDL